MLWHHPGRIFALVVLFLNIYYVFAVPETLPAIKALVTGSGSVLVTWRAPAQPNGDVSHYNVYAQAQGAEPHSYKVPATQTSYSVTDLKASRYDFWVTASTTAGESEPSETASCSPTDQVPAKIASFDASFNATYKEDVKLACLAVGVPPPNIVWKFDSKPLEASKRVRQLPDGSLRIVEVSREDAGAYSCHAANQFGTDSVTHTLSVLGHTENKQWVDTNIQSSRQAFLEGLSTGLKGPTGKGRRLIISHIGSEEGFVDDGLLMFESKKGLDDYHKEMNSEVYENWLKTILPKLKPNSVLVIDNAPYHSRRKEALPTSEWRKARLQEWLKEKNVPFHDRMLKAKLVEIARKARQAYVRHVSDEMAAERGVTVLRLPPYHCELNPIELVWAQVKGYVAKNNRTYKMNDVKHLFEEGLKQVTPQRWSDCIAHVIKKKEEMSPLGHVVESIAENCIIEVGCYSDSESNKSSSERTDSE